MPMVRLTRSQSTGPVGGVPHGGDLDPSAQNASYPPVVRAGIVAVAVAIVVATVVGLALRRRSGRFQRAEEPRMDPLLHGLGVTPGPDVTLLQFSTAFCGPCRTTRALCADVARTVPGVRHLEVDAE